MTGVADHTTNKATLLTGTIDPERRPDDLRLPVRDEPELRRDDGLGRRRVGDWNDVGITVPPHRPHPRQPPTTTGWSRRSSLGNDYGRDAAFTTNASRSRRRARHDRRRRRSPSPERSTRTARTLRITSSGVRAPRSGTRPRPPTPAGAAAFGLGDDHGLKPGTTRVAPRRDESLGPPTGDDDDFQSAASSCVG